MSNIGSLEGTAIHNWYTRQRKAGEARGRPFSEPPKYERYMEEVGFVDVHVKTIKWPMGDWMEEARNKEIGKWNITNQIEVVKSVSRATRAEGRTEEEDEAELSDITREVRDPDLHLYMPLYVVWGRKPLA